jgi:hypothetical protein
MSRHHEKETKITTAKEIKGIAELILLIQTSPERTRHSAALEARSGHGLFSTRWNGLNFSIIYLISAVYKVISVMKT